MSIARKMRRERQIQARKALRHELKDQAVREFIDKAISDGRTAIFLEGIKTGKQMVANSTAYMGYGV